MRLWNGWGKENSEFTMSMSEQMEQMLTGLIGKGNPLPQATLDDVISKVPESRLSAHPLISLDKEDRVRHARGQSLPDWLAMHQGEPGVFPDGVAFPENSDQVKQLLEHAMANDIIVIPYGGGTSVLGHINPEQNHRAILTIDMGRMNQLISIDKESQLATFGAGTAGPELEAQLKSEGYTLGHFPQSWELSTVGGWVASRSSGQQSMRYGRIEQMFAGANIETPKGNLTIPTIPASSAGPDIREMIMGSEGRMGIITEVTVRITPIAEKESYHVVFFPTWDDGVTAVRELTQQKIQLSMLRLSNPLETATLLKMNSDPETAQQLMQHLAQNGIAEGGVMMTYGVTGSDEQHQFAVQQTAKTIQLHKGISASDQLGQHWEHGRFRAPYVREPLGDAGYAVDTMETAVNWSKVPQTMHDIEHAIRTALDDENEKIHVYTHISHVYGQGSSLYTTYLFRFADSYEKTLKRWETIKAAGANQTTAAGGTISHQHGVGKDHRDYLAIEKGALGMAAIESLCELFDPEQQMNPGTLLKNKNA